MEDNYVQPYMSEYYESNLNKRCEYIKSLYNWDEKPVNSIDKNIFSYYERIVKNQKDRLKNLYMYNICQKKANNPTTCYDVIANIYIDFLNSLYYETLTDDEKQFYIKDIPKRLFKIIVYIKFLRSNFDNLQNNDTLVFLEVFDLLQIVRNQDKIVVPENVFEILKQFPTTPIDIPENIFELVSSNFKPNPASDESKFKSIARELLSCYSDINKNKFASKWNTCDNVDSVKKLAFMYVMIQDSKVLNKVTSYMSPPNIIGGMLTGGEIIITIIVIIVILLIIGCVYDGDICIIGMILFAFNGGSFDKDKLIDPRKVFTGAKLLSNMFDKEPTLVSLINAKSISRMFISMRVTRNHMKKLTTNNKLSIPSIIAMFIPFFRSKIKYEDLQNILETNLPWLNEQNKIRDIIVDWYSNNKKNTFVIDNIDKIIKMIDISNKENISYDNKYENDFIKLVKYIITNNNQAGMDQEPPENILLKKCLPDVTMNGGRNSIMIKTSKRKYKVYLDKNKHKYIKMNKSNILLKTLKGKYVYVNRQKI